MKKLILTILLIFLAGCSGNLGAEKKTLKKWEKPDSPLKLKTTKDKIYTSKTIDEAICDEVGLNCQKTGKKLVKYYYLKPIKDKKKKFEGTIKVKEKSELLGASEPTYKEVAVALDEIDRDYNRVTYGYYEDKKVTENFIGVQFVKELATGDWYELEYPATTTVDAWDAQTATTTSPIAFIKSLLGLEAKADTSTFYPDPNVGSTSGDGRAYRSIASPGETFAQITTGNGTAADSNQANGRSLFLNQGYATKFDVNLSGIFIFDTSSIPDADTIDSGTFSLYGSSVNCGADFWGSGNVEVDLVSAQTVSNTVVSAADYQNRGTTVLGSFALGAVTSGNWANWSASSYNDITLNASGLANISKVAPSAGDTLSKFGLRWSYETDSLTPTLRSAGNSCTVWGYSAEQAGTTQDPKLVVVHSAGGGETPTPTPRTSIINFQ